MAHDLLLILTVWNRVAVFIAAACTTAVPIMYSFSAWRSRKLGRLFMAMSVSFAVAIDRVVLFLIWSPKSELVRAWTNAVILSFIAVATTLLAIHMWRLNHPKKERGIKDVPEEQDVRHLAGYRPDLSSWNRDPIFFAEPVVEPTRCSCGGRHCGGC